jgi:MFS transporter, FHS family, glucose/mannose:H+ symporter
VPARPPFHDDAIADTSAGPSVAWLALGVLLAGLGTVLLGPILPAISLRWHLTDQQTGPLFFAKFVGSFLGGISVPRKLRWGIFSGTILSCIGFGAFALATGLTGGIVTLFIAGIGLGQIIASTNILAGHRYTRQTGSALSALNFFFSLGAVITGLIVATLEPRFGLRSLLFYIAAGFLATSLGGRLNWTNTTPGTPKLSPLEIGEQHPSEALNSPTLKPKTSNLKPPLFARFALFLFLYGGLETCLIGWLTTFTVRYSDAHLVGGQSAVVLLLVALTAGRALSSIALRFMGEVTIQRLGLVLSFVFIAALSTASHAASLSTWSILLGLSLAPFFPATFALLMHRNPTAREAGFILAVSGLGAAAFPWLMGIVSTHTGSLREAMAVPATLALLLLAVSFLPSEKLGHPAPEHS